MLDTQGEGFINFASYISVLSTVLKGSFQEQFQRNSFFIFIFFVSINQIFKVCFKLYDGDNDNKISLDEFQSARLLMFSFLLRKRDLLKMTFKQADRDNDNKLSWKEFEYAMSVPIVQFLQLNPTEEKKEEETQKEEVKEIQNYQEEIKLEIKEEIQQDSQRGSETE